MMMTPNDVAEHDLKVKALLQAHGMWHWRHKISHTDYYRHGHIIAGTGIGPKAAFPVYDAQEDPDQIDAARAYTYESSNPDYDPKRIKALLKQIPYADTTKLLIVDRMTQEQIAAKTGMTQGNIHHRLARAKRAGRYLTLIRGLTAKEIIATVVPAIRASSKRPLDVIRNHPWWTRAWVHFILTTSQQLPPIPQPTICMHLHKTSKFLPEGQLLEAYEAAKTWARSILVPPDRYATSNGRHMHSNNLLIKDMHA